VKELELVGYTPDLRYLVFSHGLDGTRFRVPVDGDLIETLGEILELTDPDHPALLPRPTTGDVPTGAEPQPAGPELEEPETEPKPEPAEPEPEPRFRPGVGALAAVAFAEPPEAEPPNGEPEPARSSTLSPREIQALLRAGQSPRVVAGTANTDEAWVLRWLPPIEAEREEVLRSLQRAQVVKPRLGPSHDRFGEAVRRNLVAKHVDPSAPTVRWFAARPEGDDAWTVTLRYRSRNKAQKATWRFWAETGDVVPVNKLAAELAWTRPPNSRRSMEAAGIETRGRFPVRERCER
jgi:hypothetical protein